MGFFASLKAQQAMRAHGKGDIAKAKQLYEEALAKGLMESRPMLGYALLLIREGSFEKAMALLLKTQKAPDLTPDRKSQLFVDYAACCAKTGQLEKGVKLLERQHDRTPTGLTYQTLGYLYVEQYDAVNKPVAEELAPVYDEEGNEVPQPTKAERQAEIDAQWQEGVEKAFALLQASIDYDDEDPVCLDNMGQALYRIKGDKVAAKEWFDKAHAEKPGQIDSLWFLSRYDLEAGDTAAAIDKLETALEGNFSPLNYADRKMVEDELKRLKGN
ncbi:MAG: tetratricopeptide repeat protein [Clostridia bacterium]|nr:tetratricopeptide repeat protein [Clostridia bacterium]